MKKRNRIEIFFIVVDVLVIISAIILIYMNVFSWNVLKRAIIFLIIFSMYRYIGEYLALPLIRSHK